MPTESAKGRVMTDSMEELRELQQKILLLERDRQLQAMAVTGIEEELKYLDGEERLLERVGEVLQVIGKKVLGHSTASIDQLVTAGLKLAFDDQGLEFRTSVERFRGYTSVKFELMENGRLAPIRDSYGGGVLVLIGVLLRVVTIMTLDLKKFLVLDEALSHVSDKYIAPCSRFLQQLCADLDFTIILITHASEFTTHADVHYSAKKSKGVTVFSQVSKGKPVSEEI